MTEKILPSHGRPREEILRELTAARGGDIDWKSGKTFSLIYNCGEDVMSFANEAYSMFIIENGLGPMAFPSLRRLETEVVAMAANLLGGGAETVGSMTCGGTESIFMAVKTARDWARAKRPEVKEPEIVIPLTAHPAFDKAAHYLDMKIVHAPVDENFRATAKAVEESTTGNTVFIAASAMTYPHGVVDPIAEIAEFAASRKIWFHVDSCLGGMILPFARRLDHDIPDFDFSVPGVVSMSCDLHKYGYAPKGASLVLYRNKSYRSFQYFAYADWPGGVYGTSTFAGARTGGPIAGAWAVMNYLGEEGYLRLARKALDASRKLIDGVRAVPGLKVMGAPHATVFSIGSDTLNVYALSDALAKRGWLLEKQHLPPCLHVTVSPRHFDVADEFLAALADAAKEVGITDASAISQEAAMYGMMATMPDRRLASELAVEFLNDLYRLKDD